MNRKRLHTIFAIVPVLLGLVFVCFAVPSVNNDAPPLESPKPVKIKLPKSLYCAMTAIQDRYSINLRPISNALGEPAETWEVVLFRNDHLVTPLGKIGGGEKLEEFILFTLPPVDADAFKSTMEQPFNSRAESMNQAGRNFQLRILNTAGDLLASKKIVLFLN
jgi:hypothetical protein